MANKLKASTGGYISVERGEVLRQNWPLLKNMLRPATMPASSIPPTKENEAPSRLRCPKKINDP